MRISDLKFWLNDVDEKTTYSPGSRWDLKRTKNLQGIVALKYSSYIDIYRNMLKDAEKAHLLKIVRHRYHKISEIEYLKCDAKSLADKVMKQLFLLRFLNMSQESTKAQGL